MQIFKLDMLIVILLSLSLYMGCFNEPGNQIKQPNVILILADDQGWGDLSIHNNPLISTPNIDRLAKEGASFERFFVQPVCSPTRAEILTGRYHPRSGVRSTSAGGERIDLDETLVSESFKKAGYRTGCFGKWHSGSQHPYHPNNRGFDEYYGFTSGHWGHYFSPKLDSNGTFVQGAGYLPDDLTNCTIRFMENQKNPFFIFLNFNTPHSPMQVPDKWWDKFASVHMPDSPNDDYAQNHARAALAMVENIDWNVGRILFYLEEAGIEEETIVMYMTDNGPNGVRWNGNMKGRKGSTDEGGVRSPLFIKWSGVIPENHVISHIAAAIDLAPTLVELCGLSQSDSKFDGRSLAPLLKGIATDWTSRVLFQHWRGKTSVRSQNHRLDHENRLYDMIEDPSQIMEITDDYAHLKDSLIRLKKDWEANVLKELAFSMNRPFTIGYSSSQIDYLPARDGIGHGGILRSNRYPNDSYFLNWTNTSDSITWDIEILQNGTYRFYVHYTCEEEDVGSIIRLSVGDSNLTYAVNEVNQSNEMGADHDRVRRIESYVKDFKKQFVGTVDLNKGLGTMKLSAISIPNKHVMDINMITVQRID